LQKTLGRLDFKDIQVGGKNLGDILRSEKYQNHLSILVEGNKEKDSLTCVTTNRYPLKVALLCEVLQDHIMEKQGNMEEEEMKEFEKNLKIYVSQKLLPLMACDVTPFADSLQRKQVLNINFQTNFSINPPTESVTYSFDIKKEEVILKTSAPYVLRDMEGNGEAFDQCQVKANNTLNVKYKEGTRLEAEVCYTSLPEEFQ
jgi:hypothetical protein